MSLRFQPGAPLDAELKRVLQQELAKTLQCALDATTPLQERVRLARRGCKNGRALLRLLRPHLPRYAREENCWLRDSARALSALRDLDALQGTLAALAKGATRREQSALTKVHRRLGQIRRARLPKPDDEEQQLAHTLQRLEETAQRWDHLELPKIRAKEAAEAFRQSYRRARRAFKTAIETGAAPDFHEWRKAVKVLAFHYKVFRCAWPKPMKAHQRSLRDLGKLLGDEHDLNVFKGQLQGELRSGTKNEMALAADLVERRIKKVRQQCVRLGRRLFTAKPKSVAAELKTWWEIAESKAAKSAKR